MELFKITEKTEMNEVYKEVLKNKVKAVVISDLKRFLNCEYKILDIADNFKVQIEFTINQLKFSKVATINYAKKAKSIKEQCPKLLDLMYTDFDFNAMTDKEFGIKKGMFKRVKKHIISDLIKHNSKNREIRKKEVNQYLNIEVVDSYLKVNTTIISNLEPEKEVLVNFISLDNILEPYFFEDLKEGQENLNKLNYFEKECNDLFVNLIKKEIEDKYNIEINMDFKFKLNDKLTNMFTFEIKVANQKINMQEVFVIDYEYYRYQIVSTYYNYSHKDTLNEMTKYFKKIKTKIILDIEKNI